MWCAEHSKIREHELKRANPTLLSSIEEKYGSLEEACTKLKLPFEAPAAKVTEWTTSMVIDNMKELHDTGKPMTQVNAKKVNAKLPAEAAKFFGTWKKAVDACGYGKKKAKAKETIDPKQLKDNVTQWVEENGALNSKALRSTDQKLYTALIAKYKSIETAATALAVPFLKSPRGRAAWKIRQEENTTEKD